MIIVVHIYKCILRLSRVRHTPEALEVASSASTILFYMTDPVVCWSSARPCLSFQPCIGILLMFIH